MLRAFHARGSAGAAVRQGALLLLLLLYTCYTFGPLLWVFSMSLKTTPEIRESPYTVPVHPRLDSYRDVWVNSNYRTYFMNSGFVVGFAIVILILVAAMGAYCFAKLPFKGSGLIFFIIFSSIMLPAQVTLIPLFQLLVKYHLDNSLFGLGLVYVTVQLPMAMYVLRSFFAQIPADLSEAAKIDGCSEWGTFWRVMFPIAGPAVSTILIVNFTALWNEFLYAVIFLRDESKRTLPLGVMKFAGEAYEDLGRIAVGLIISIIPVIVLYLLFSERFIKGMSAGAVKG